LRGAVLYRLFQWQLSGEISPSQGGQTIRSVL